MEFACDEIATQYATRVQNNACTFAVQSVFKVTPFGSTRVVALVGVALCGYIGGIRKECSTNEKEREQREPTRLEQ